MRRLALAACMLAACNDAPAPAGTGSTSGGGTTTATTTPSTSADESTTVAPEPVIVLDAALELELDDDIRVTVTTIGDAVEVAIDPSRGFGLVVGPLVGPGRIDAYPEAEATLYTATFAGPAVEDGPCGAEPVALALSLHHDHDADVIAGGLTGYCGGTTFHGVPPIEPLRISGRIP